MRSVRVYHEKRVLPPPEVRGRTGFYTDTHLARLRAVSRLLARGVQLAGVTALFDAWDRGEGLADVLGFIDEIATPWYRKEPGTRVSAARLTEWYEEHATPEDLERARRLGVFESTDDPGVYEVTSPALHRFGAELVAAGLPMTQVLDELEHLTADCERITARGAELFRRQVWDAYQASERGPDDLAQVTRYLAVSRRRTAAAVAELVSRALERVIQADSPELLAQLPAGDAPRSESGRE